MLPIFRLQYLFYIKKIKKYTKKKFPVSVLCDRGTNLDFNEIEDLKKKLKKLNFLRTLTRTIKKIHQKSNNLKYLPLFKKNANFIFLRKSHLEYSALRKLEFLGLV